MNQKFSKKYIKKNFDKNSSAAKFQNNRFPRNLKKQGQNHLLDFPELKQNTQNPSFEPEFQQKRTPKKSDFQSLVQIAANRFGIGITFKAVQICQESRNILAEFFPNLDSQKIRPVSYKDGILTLSTSSSNHSQLLLTKKHLLQEKLNQKFGSSTVSSIKIRLH